MTRLTRPTREDVGRREPEFSVSPNPLDFLDSSYPSSLSYAGLDGKFLLTFFDNLLLTNLYPHPASPIPSYPISPHFLWFRILLRFLRILLNRRPRS